ncbi:hypothetical protein MB84_19050 [Pandoraea oxalativorans]|uniref:Uncharacterized protein n=1 Tax=Pandoraea oxalativorans TaxID=573737 RepID=A0A0E3U8A4_9BURK|nr:hypothetical protein MB84_19050 [Pandoraea oxalativorans]
MRYRVNVVSDAVPCRAVFCLPPDCAASAPPLVVLFPSAFAPDTLRALGYDFASGDVLSKPLPQTELVD